MTPPPLSSPPSPPAPRGQPERRMGNARLLIETFPGVTLDDRLRGAASLLAGTGFTITAEERAP